MSLMGTKLNSLTFKVLPFCYRRIFTANYSTAASGTTSSSTSSTQLNELARKHVPNFPGEEEILARSWNKPQWERRERNVRAKTILPSKCIDFSYRFLF
ncbi:hypothetical protein GJ496_006654 [Pomphorhynchus laevis]|nr:hypothetical protein GJ496_006654 [Pomphorhynchus laevis]